VKKEELPFFIKLFLPSAHGKRSLRSLCASKEGFARLKGMESIMFRKKRLMGLIFFFVGVGMIVQFMMPGWGFLIASALIIMGFWHVFVR